MKRATVVAIKKRKVKERTREQKIKSQVIPALRNRSRYWKEKQIARKLAKRKVQVGLTLKGKPKYKTFWECEMCGKMCGKGESQMDHRLPVVDPSIGWVNYDTFIDRLFCEAKNYSCLCIDCHTKKSKKENELREKIKNGKNKRNN